MGSKKYDLLFSETEKEQIIKDYVENFLSIREIGIKYNIKSKSYISNLLQNKTRNVSQANKIAHKKYPEKFLHSQETKNKMREKRLTYMKLHPEQTAWRIKNESYPEKIFEKFLIENGYSEKYLIQREYSVFPYFIDFAFVDLKIAIEIDGSQHLLEERRKKDEKKDILLQENGWKVIRIAENVVKNEWDTISNVLNKFINVDNNLFFEKVGIIYSPKKNRQLVKRDRFGRSEKMNNSAIKQRHVERPSAEQLVEDLKTSNFTKVGEKYGVSDNAIRKWCLFYGLSNKSKDYK